MALRLAVLLALPWLSCAELGRQLRSAEEAAVEVAMEEKLIELDQKTEEKEDDKVEPTTVEEAKPVDSTTVEEPVDEDHVQEDHLAAFLGLGMPDKVIGICGTLMVVAYAWFACGFAGLFNKSDGYTAFQSESAPPFTAGWYYVLAAFLMWFAMPLTMLYFAKDATCEGGPSDLGYTVYLCFLAAHIVLMVIAVWKSPLKVNFCDCSKDIFLWGPVLVFFLILDHMDMATDALFLGSAVACSDRIAFAYQSSWEAIPGAGPELSFTIQELNFSGLALFCFINFAYLPQLTGQTPFFALLTSMICAGMMLLTLHFGSMVGFIALAVVLVIYALGGAFAKQWKLWRQYCVDDEMSIALYCGFGIFEQALTEGQANERLLFVTMTRLVFENLLQLWLQTSFFSLTFHFTDGGARVKNLLSMVIGLLVGASKVPGLIKELREGSSWVKLTAGFNCGTFMAWVLLFVVIFYALVLVWISARLCFSYYCESHMWGLTTGCLPQ